MSGSPMCYIGVKRCGCAVVARVDEPDIVKNTAKAVSEWIRRGWTCERIPLDEAKFRLKICTHEEKEPALR